MRYFLVIPPDFALSAKVRARLGRHAVIREVPNTPRHLIDLELVEPDGTDVLILSDPWGLSDDELISLIDLSETEVLSRRAVAFVPGTETTPTLATAAAVYAFPGKDVHLAGGLDSNMPLSALGIDTQFRLSGRFIGSVAHGTSAVHHVPKLATASYLRVLTKNVTSQVQLAYLAPLFAGLVDHSLRSEGVDTTCLDLQRSPGGEAENLLTVPAGAFEGAETLREWAADLGEIEKVKYVTSEARRIPDRRLPHLAQFIDEVWDSASIPSDRRRILEDAFEDVLFDRHPQITFTARSDNPPAVERMNRIVAELHESAYWWDPATRALLSWEQEGWNYCADSPDRAADASAINFLVGVTVREAPWVQTSPSIVIVDLTVIDLITPMTDEWVGHSVATPFLGPSALLFSETIRRADRVLTLTEATRDFVLGAVAAVHRLDQYTYDEDPSLESLISIEDGERAALAAIARPVHPFDQVRTTPEYERSPHAALAKSMSSMSDRVRSLTLRTGDRLRGARK